MTAAEWVTIKHFRPAEFDSKDAPGSGFSMMDLSLVSRLDHLRDLWGAPLVVASGFRSLAHNDAVGGVKDSAHLRGLAADLKTDNLPQCIRLSHVARGLGFRRIGIDLLGHLLHVDTDATLPQDVTWFYNESSVA